MKRAGEQCSAWWPAMRDLFPTQWSCIAAREDVGEQTLHTHVYKLPRTLPSKGELPNHLLMMLVLSDRYHLEVHLGSNLDENEALRLETFEFQCRDMLLFAYTLRHRCLTTLLGVGKVVVLFRFHIPDERHTWAGGRRRVHP